MRYTILLTALILTSISVKGQSKTEAQLAKEHRRVVKHSKVIENDSVYYAPDTIAVVFQELIIKPDTVYAKWTKGFVIWQTYSAYGATFSSAGGIWTTGTLSAYKAPEYYVNPYEGSKLLSDKFLYADRKTKVTNKVIYSIKQ